jgi:TolB-like protein/DNA-binding winged helix-turn-helix (wHTH) protein/Tfp pilus assembly protein PilF
MEAEIANKDRTGFHFDDVIVDPDNARVSRNGVEIKLPGKAFDLLVALLQAAPNLLTHDDIMNQVWADNIVNDETIKQNISRIRSALRDDSKNPAFIESVRGKGYRIICAVKTVDMSEIPYPVSTKAPARKLILPGVTLVLVITALWFFGVMRPILPPTTNAAPLRIAVLPFITLNKDDQDAYLADGLTEELISALAQSGDFKVLARTTTLAYRDSEATAATIAKQLKLDAIVEGSIRRVDDRIRVYVQLIDGASEEHIWSLEFDRPYEEIFNVRSEVIGRISDSLIQVPAAEARVEIPTHNMDAYDDYLKGQVNYREGTDDSNNTAIVYFERAIERDPEFAEAFAWLANAYAIKARHQVDDTYAAKALEIASKAQQMSPDSAVANKALGIAYSYLGRSREARQSSERTLQLDPDYPAAINNLASVYMDTGEFARAAELYKQLIDQYADEINFLAKVYAHYAFNMNALGYSEVAMDAIRIAVELDPSHPNVMLSRNYILLTAGELELATSYAADFIEINQDCTFCILTAADNYYFSGDQQQAMILYQDVYERSLQSDSDAAIRIAQIKLESGSVQSAEIQALLDTARRNELRFLEAAHEDWLHFYRLGLVAITEKNYAVAYDWFMKASLEGFYDETWLASEPTLEDYRNTDFYLKNIQFIQGQKDLQRQYVRAHGIDAFTTSR